LSELDLQGRIDRIRQDRTSGAVELAIQAAEILVLLSEQPGLSAAALRETALALVRAQPAMAPLFNLANEVLFHRPDELSTVCHDFIYRLQRAGQAIATLAAGLIRDGMTVLTHSYSSTVFQTLLLAKRAGRQFGVLCTESRPLREGVTLARKLAQQGIPVSLIVDAAVFRFLSRTQLVLVGADAVSAQGLVNKIGTAPLALAARTLGIDVYALAGSEKFFPAGYCAPAEQPKAPTEILEEAALNLTPVNLYFDSTPLEYLTGLITEQGILPPGDFERSLRDRRIHPALISLRMNPGTSRRSRMETDSPSRGARFSVLRRASARRLPFTVG
jgi:translation initiation factor eIF-2B subunit delta